MISILVALILSMTSHLLAATVDHPRPYKQAEINHIYNLLFADDINLLRSNDKPPKNSPLEVLLASKPDPTTVQKLATDQSQESRVRLLAFSWLRLNNVTIPDKKKLLGVVVEVPLNGSLDVLAAYEDNRVRYINQSEKIAILESASPEMAAKVRELLSVSQKVVDRHAPANKKRVLPPGQGNIRLNFLASDGLYVSEGGFSAMQKDGLTGPVVQKATDLLVLVTRLGGKPSK